jgi:hypothetical protein
MLTLPELALQHITKKGIIMDNEINDRSVNPLIRIADALEEILRLVKTDQEKYTAREAREMLQSEEN